MGKHLVDIDEGALAAARAELGTDTIKDTVNESLRAAAPLRAHLLDTSVLTRLHQPQSETWWKPLAAAGRAARAGISDLEIGFSARNATGWDRLNAALRAFDLVETTAKHVQRARAVQRLLASSSQRGRKIPDLLVAAAAEEAGLVFLHYDTDFDLIATTRRKRWSSRSLPARSTTSPTSPPASGRVASPDGRDRRTCREGRGGCRHRGPMTRFVVMSTQSLASVKAHFSAVVDSVQATHERVTVTKNGIPTVVVVAVEDLESLEETLAILGDQDTMRQLREAEREVAAGDTLDAAELRELLGGKAIPE